MLTLKHLPINSFNENLAYVHKDCTAYKVDDIRSLTKVEIHGGVKTVFAFLQVVDDARLCKPGELALNTEAFNQINLPEGANVSLTLSAPPPSLASIKRKNKRLSVQYSAPVWLVATLIEEYGQERAEAILASLFIRNKASVRVTDLSKVDELARTLEAEKSALSPVGLVKASGHFAGSQAFKDGLITIQDETSQLVAPTLQLEGWEEVLDACAAPGGKTCHIASYLTNGQVIALDLYDHKLRLIEENAQRLGVGQQVRTQNLDARQVAEVFGPDRFDKILVDAPCSGIGLIRRKPDIKYNKESADFDQLQEIQLAILDSVCQSLKKGGIITYSTCTIVGKENQDVIAKFLERHPNFEQVALTHACSNIVQDGCILITPEQYLTDGFFIGQVRKKS